MTPVLTIALPIFAIIGAGFTGARLGLMTADDSKALNKFVFQFAMPAALFGLTSTTPPPGSADAALAGAYATAAAIGIFGGYFLAKKLFNLTGPQAGAHGFTATLGNAVFLGLPIALTLDGWARPYVVLMLIEGIFVIAIGAALMTDRSSNDKSPLSFFAGPFRNPLVLGVAAGFVYSASGIPLPIPVESFFKILGRAAGPTALFSLGVFLATHQFPKLTKVAGRVSLIASIKMIMLPIIALVMAYQLGISDPTYLGALALFVFVPAGVGTFVMASQYGVAQTEVASAVLVTTIISIFTISGVLMFFV